MLKLRYMINSLMGDEVVYIRPISGLDGMILLGEPGSNENSYSIHWFEAVIMHIGPRVAVEWAVKQPQRITINWAKQIVKQKILNEITRTHPVDFLFELWKHPEKYAETL